MFPFMIFQVIGSTAAKCAETAMMIFGAVLRFPVEVFLDVSRHVMLEDGRVRTIRTLMDLTLVQFLVTDKMAANGKSFAANFTTYESVLFAGSIVSHFRQMMRFVHFQVIFAAAKNINEDF